jgi:hypothetical protein
MLVGRSQLPWNGSVGQLIGSSRYGPKKIEFSFDCASCSSGLCLGFRDVRVFQLTLLSVRLSDCAHEFGSSLCDACIAHFEGVQFVLYYKLASEGGFGRAVVCFPGGFSCQGGRGGVETWWGRRLVLMSLPCFVLMVPSTMRPSANGQPVFRRGLGFHTTVTMGVWLWGSLFCCNPWSLWLAAVRNPVIRAPEKRLFSGKFWG